MKCEMSKDESIFVRLRDLEKTRIENDPTEPNISHIVKISSVKAQG